ncbi:DUF453 domain protein [Stachybotrys elegans]|uniref:DUF453 domain protein n=1 Tax=Stachybotrys elegans TaxID=80388 RepID=A0A8K0SQL6_9HYPO|nr:DUF453 domain protein [Stachybotrys elegans]
MSTASTSTATPLRPQQSLTASYYRGGSSRAVFFREQDLPPDLDRRAQIFRGVIGSPDPNGRQLDGMGGGISSLSKICVVGPPSRPDADVDYTFVQIGVRDDKVDYSSNCGNMSSAVGPYAVDAGLVPIPDNVSQDGGQVTVRIHNTNTGKLIHSSFPVVQGEAAAMGDLAIDGVAGTGAPIKLDFVDPAGSRTGKLLPTGNAVDVFDGLPVSCIDVGNPCCFVAASALGVDGTLTPDEIEANIPLKQQLESLRRQASIKMGLAAHDGQVTGSVPKIAIVSPNTQDGSQASVVVRAMSVGQAHKAIPVTVALATAAASKLVGTTVNECLSKESREGGEVDIAHASGWLKVDASYDAAGNLVSATVFRTARRLMEGRIFWK